MGVIVAPASLSRLYSPPGVARPGSPPEGVDLRYRDPNSGVVLKTRCSCCLRVEPLPSVLQSKQPGGKYRGKITIFPPIFLDFLGRIPYFPRDDLVRRLLLHYYSSNQGPPSRSPYFFRGPSKRFQQIKEVDARLPVGPKGTNDRSA